MLSFYVSAKDLNSAPHIFTTNTLPAESSFQPWTPASLPLCNTFDLCRSFSSYPSFTLIDFSLRGHKESFHSPTGGLLVCVQFQITVHRMKKMFSVDISFHAIMVNIWGRITRYKPFPWFYRIYLVSHFMLSWSINYFLLEGRSWGVFFFDLGEWSENVIFIF